MKNPRVFRASIAAIVVVSVSLAGWVAALAAPTATAPATMPAQKINKWQQKGGKAAFVFLKPPAEYRRLIGIEAAPRTTNEIYKKTAQGDLSMTLYWPADWRPGDRRAAIVFLFAGGWEEGTPKQFAPQAEYFATRGMVAACPEYRIKRRHHTDPTACVEDAKSAVRWLRGNAARLGLAPDKVVAAGESAGGHLAACTAMANGFEAKGENISVSSLPNALILYSSTLRFGDDPELVKLVEDAKTAMAISPFHLVRFGLPPTLILIGTRDFVYAPVPEFVQRMKAAGNRVDFDPVEDEIHLFQDWAPDLQKMLLRADAFLASLGWLQGPATVKIPADKTALQAASTASEAR